MPNFHVDATNHILRRNEKKNIPNKAGNPSSLTRTKEKPIKIIKRKALDWLSVGWNTRGSKSNVQ